MKENKMRGGGVGYSAGRQIERTRANFRKMLSKYIQIAGFIIVVLQSIFTEQPKNKMYQQVELIFSKVSNQCTLSIWSIHSYIHIHMKFNVN